jgi:excisionase family DNA binding protein
MVMAQRMTIRVPEISERLGICEETVYDMLRAHEIPNIRHVRRFIVSRAAYEHWEATIGEGALPASPSQASPKRPESFQKPMASKRV